MFNRCFNLEGTIPAIWDESEFYGSASQYAPKNLPDFDTEHTYYDDEGGTVGHSEYYINGKGARVGDETAVQHFKNGYLLASGCFNGCWKLDNFYDIPVTWLATNALSVVYYTEIE